MGNKFEGCACIAKRNEDLEDPEYKTEKKQTQYVTFEENLNRRGSKSMPLIERERAPFEDTYDANSGVNTSKLVLPAFDIS